jgi:hypothetical protein
VTSASVRTWIRGGKRPEPRHVVQLVRRHGGERIGGAEKAAQIGNGAL